MDFTKMFCLDFEASGLEPTGYPIEVAVVNVATGATHSWLIRPTAEWQAFGHWSPESAQIHKIPWALLQSDGVPAEQVTRELAEVVGQATVLCDSMRYDGKWLRDLYRTSDRDPPFKLASFSDLFFDVRLATDMSMSLLLQAMAAAAKKYPEMHRAAPDAQRNAEILRQFRALTDP